MRASFKHHHLNNIKVDLQDKKMTLLVIHYKLISRYTELRTRKREREKETAFTLLWFTISKKKKKMTVHDNIFFFPVSGLDTQKRLKWQLGSPFLISYHRPHEQSAVQQVILPQYECKIASNKRPAKPIHWQLTLEEDSHRNKS